MLRYVGRRLLQMIPVFFGATLLIYALVFLMPGDPVQALGGDRGLSAAAEARVRAEYNLINHLSFSTCCTSKVCSPLTLVQPSLDGPSLK